MEIITTFLGSNIGDIFANGKPLDLALQSGFLFLAAFISLLVHARWDRSIDLKVAESSGSSSRFIALRATKRLSFPLTFAVLILLFYSLFELFGYPAGFFHLAWPLAFVFAVISILVFLLRVAAAPGAGSVGIERFVSITLWTVFALYLLGWLPVASALLDGFAFSIGEVRISLLGVAKFLVVSAVLVLVALAMSRYIEGRLSSSQVLDSGVRTGLIEFIRYGLIGLAILVALGVAGFDLTTLTVIGGALGIGIGFGLQKVTSNLISGFLILFDRSIRPGDVISIGESYGWVQKICARYLVVRDRDGVDTLIPNEEIVTTRVINWSYGDRHVRLKLPVQISYRDDPKLAIRLLQEASRVNDRVLENPAPVVHLMGFGDDGTNLELRAWINDPEQGVNNVRSDINLAIWDAFAAHGITIPYPQRDLHIKRSEQMEVGTTRE